MKRKFLFTMCGALCALASANANAGVYGSAGVGCQSDYEANWCTTLSYAWNNCSGFKNHIGGAKFYYNLRGGKPYWENTYDQYEMDTVDIYYSETHGGAWGTEAVWAMWDYWTLASSANMRLGDESTGLSVLSTYSCETLKIDGIISRWRNIMRGGLRYATGSFDKLYDGSTTDECGADYADNLNSGYTIRYAWSDALSDWWVDNDAAVLATGANATDCANRRDGMRWTNYRYYPRLRDNQASYYCWAWWDNL